MPLVVDASVALAWALLDELSTYAEVKLAVREGLRLATLDSRMREAAEKPGVSLFDAPSSEARESTDCIRTKRRPGNSSWLPPAKFAILPKRGQPRPPH